MPLLTPQNKVQLDDFKCKLPLELIADVHAYAAAIESDVNYVVTKALEKLTSDKDFQTWKEKNREKLAAPRAITDKSKRGPKAKDLKAVSAA